MCAACGNVQHIVVDPMPSNAPAPAKFIALRNRDCRFYLGGTLLSMMADNVEHQIIECSM
jgi:hypothetical protein